METWVEAGQDAARFWHLTPREIHHILKGVVKRLEREAGLSEELAWNTGRATMHAYHQPKSFPRLADFSLRRPAQAAPRRRDWREIKAAVVGWNAVVGGKVVPK